MGCSQTKKCKTVSFSMKANTQIPAKEISGKKQNEKLQLKLGILTNGLQEIQNSTILQRRFSKAQPSTKSFQTYHKSILL